ncbi:bifunctional NAD(P)H-hydrate repair enzyme Nnr [Alicyclobacillus contaminans]|uniref:NAD(P)H-hydrate dehydratase n=1 Tax=Alicyclobacillus contaminans TaxID=392016 RepID=UPI0004168906|nr:NAD(P)H-hydrate dehydratase [Alicyclobacillus contaminans]GMA51141.1 bifunctional NAD(P)H-hydrate repair enzyme Nnr [Alicyclobacillus contaminans]
MYLVTSEQMQTLDKRTMARGRVPGLLLMDHAGRHVAERVLLRRPQRVVVLCGKGNNGGDGWTAARWLHHFGVADVTVLSLVSPSDLGGDARRAAEMAEAAGVPWHAYREGMDLPTADVYVDALLGTGVSRPLAGPLAELVDAVNQASPWTIAVDVPTGVDASTGRVQGSAIRAHETVAMAYQKLGTAVTPGCLYAGDVVVADIGIVRDIPGDCAAFVTAEDVRRVIRPRHPATHKGSFGRVGVAVGAMPGAAVLAGLGAARVGAGWVALGAARLPGHVPIDFVRREQPPTPAMFEDCTSLVVGPGLGADAPAWMTVVEHHAGPGVLDADALPWSVTGLRTWSQWVLTPHPKECARLLGWDTAQVQENRLQAARQCAQVTGAVVVLKGYRSIVAAADGRLRVIPTGDASLATAGTGDVLAGMIGGLLAQGATPFDAACAGAYVHGVAGELAGERLGQASVMASDVVDNISRAIKCRIDSVSEQRRD